MHNLSAKATAAYEAARESVARFINAASNREVVFTGGATSAINLVAFSWGVNNLQPGDEVRLAATQGGSAAGFWHKLQSFYGFWVCGLGVAGCAAQAYAVLGRCCSCVQ